jgi:hypothetical protein
LGHGQVFKDVDSIQLGDDFVEVITRAVGSCDVLLALIGDEWPTMTGDHGRRRLDNPDDFVRLEIGPYEIVCPGCGDDPGRDWSEISGELRRIRGLYGTKEDTKAPLMDHIGRPTG